MSRPAIAPGEYHGTCRCGRPYETAYSAWYGECRRREGIREVEALLGADMLRPNPDQGGDA
jgi:hypothetical protein